MYRFYQKNPLGFALVCIAAYVVLFSAADSFSSSLAIQKIITAPVSVVLSLVLFGFLKKHGLLETYGLCPFQGDRKAFAYFLPLLLIVSTNLWNGAAMNASVLETVLFILSMLCVGFLEEVIFRGLLYKALCADNGKTAIIISSATFGLGHIVNLLNGAEVLPTLLQICYATAIGFLFCIIFLRGKSLLPCILAHGIVNSLSLFGISGSEIRDILTSLVLCVVSLWYAIYILRKTEPSKAAA